MEQTLTTLEAMNRVMQGEKIKDVAQDLEISYSALKQRLKKIPEYREYRKQVEAEKTKIQEEALKRALAGEDVRQIAEEFGVTSSFLYERLKKNPEYREYRQRQDEDLEDKKQQAVELGKQGYHVAGIARKISASEAGVRRWLNAAGIDTSLDATDDMECPACEGTMKKQELFFWKCKCQAEFWPDESNVPEDPDTWERPWRLRMEDESLIVMMKRLYNEGKNGAEIAQALNEAGYKTAKGYDWSQGNTVNYLKKYNIMPDYKKQRERVLEICKAMAGKQGISCKDIADRLNREGLTTNRNQPWSMHSVLKVIRNSLKLDVNLYRTDSIMLKREPTGTGKIPGESHPWRVAEHKGYLKWKHEQEQKGDAGK